jgi:gamma-glutamylputrescine oxidase
MTEPREGGNPRVGFEKSWYYATATEIAPFPRLEASMTADVCIVGGGYTGLSAAIELAEAGMSVVLLESYRVGAGASGRNGGVLGSGQRKDQDVLEEWLGEDDARRMWQIACDANQLVRDRIARFNIDCHLKDGELTVAHRARYESELWDYAEHLEKRYHYPHLTAVSRDEVREMLGIDSYFGGYVDRQAGHIHPLNLAIGLARAADESGAMIFEHSAATAYKQVPEGVIVNTDAGEVRARYLIIACNGYLDGFEKIVDRYQMPINNFVLATEPLGSDLARSINRDDLAVVDTRFVVNYFHNSPDHRLIFGGGENYSSKYPHDIKAFVRKRMLEVYPDLKDVGIDYGWGGTLAITMRRMPHFGRKGESVYWAQGYSGHGIAMANMGGKLIAEAIKGNAAGFDLFANLKHFPFPGGRLLRWPALVAGMLYYSMLDRF